MEQMSCFSTVSFILNVYIQKWNFREHELSREVIPQDDETLTIHKTGNRQKQATLGEN